MDAASILSQVDQEQFKQEVISALTSGAQPLDPNVTTALNKLSKKKSFKLDELRALFHDRGHENYFEHNEIIESVIEQRKKINEVKVYSQVMDGCKLSEVGGASFGYNPATGKFDRQVVLEQRCEFAF